MRYFPITQPVGSKRFTGLESMFVKLPFELVKEWKL